MTLKSHDAAADEAVRVMTRVASTQQTFEVRGPQQMSQVRHISGDGHHKLLQGSLSAGEHGRMHEHISRWQQLQLQCLLLF